MKKCATLLHMNMHKAEAILSENGLKPTEIRKSLLMHLYNSDQPKSSESLHKELELENTHVHRATLYRDLKLFLDTKLITKLTILGEHSELYVVNTQHTHHFKCQVCGKIKSFNTETLDDEIQLFLDKLSKKNNWAINLFAFKVYGECELCQKRKEVNDN